MRRNTILSLALIAAFSLSAASEAEAGRRRGNNRRARVSQRSNGGFFASVMELERRKNAWLRSTFFGG